MIDVKETVVGRRASERIARFFSGELSASEAEQLALQNADAHEQQVCLDTLHALASVDQLLDDPELQALAGQPAPKAGRFENWRKYSAAAGIVLFLGAALIMVFDSRQNASDGDIKRYVTRVGEQKTVTLDDNSVLTINTGSEVLVDYSSEQRQLVLNRGEVFFEVQRDQTRPFSVTVESRKITVLGTSFNIRKDPEAFTLSVVEGLVAVHDKTDMASSEALKIALDTAEPITIDAAGQYLVEAGMVSHFDLKLNQLIASRPKDMEYHLRWRTGMLRFENRPLSEVVNELNRYSHKKILIEDSAVMELEVYAAFKVDRVNMALADLERTMPIRVVKYFDRVVIKSKNIH